MKKVEKLNSARLTVVEFGQHIKTTLQGLTTGEGGFITDTVLTDYVNALKTQSNIYDKAILQIVKSDETARIVSADKERDIAISAALRMLNAYEFSINTSELAAFASLTNLFNTYKGLQAWNFEEESNGIDNLIVELETTKYQQHITTLNMNSHVTRMKNSNDDFKDLFVNRIHETAVKEVFDLKAIRKETKAVYEDLVTYVFAMSKALNTDEFNLSLNHINAVRKYYSDLLARRNTKTPTETPPV